MKPKTTPTSQDNETTRLGESIKLCIDVHIEKYVVVMKIDGSSPNRPRSFTPEDFLVWVRQLRKRCDSLYICYEAGPFGYSLHRKLESIDVVNYVIRPINWGSFTGSGHAPHRASSFVSTFPI